MIAAKKNVEKVKKRKKTLKMKKKVFEDDEEEEDEDEDEDEEFIRHIKLSNKEGAENDAEIQMQM